MRGLVKTGERRGNYGTPVSYRGQSPHKPRATTKKK